VMLAVNFLLVQRHPAISTMTWAITQAVSLRLPTAAVRGRTQVRSFGTCGGR
jgi:hypothetical protein